MTQDGPFRKLTEFIELNYYQARVTFTNTRPTDDGTELEYQVFFRTPSIAAVDEADKKSKAAKDQTDKETKSKNATDKTDL